MSNQKRSRDGEDTKDASDAQVFDHQEHQEPERKTRKTDADGTLMVYFLYHGTDATTTNRRSKVYRQTIDTMSRDMQERLSSFEAQGFVATQDNMKMKTCDVNTLPVPPEPEKFDDPEEQEKEQQGYEEELQEYNKRQAVIEFLDELKKTAEKLTLAQAFLCGRPTKFMMLEYEEGGDA